VPLVGYYVGFVRQEINSKKTGKSTAWCQAVRVAGQEVVVMRETDLLAFDGKLTAGQSAGE